MIVLPNLGRLWLAQTLWNEVAAYDPTLTVQLFTNDYAPVVGSVNADFTRAVFTGYASVDYLRSNISLAAMAGNEARVLLSGANPVQWTCTANPQTIYGWFLTLNNADGIPILAERYDVPVALQVGSVHTLYPYVDLGKFLAD